MAGRPVYYLIPKEEKFVSRLIVRLESYREAILTSAFLTAGAIEALKGSRILGLKQGAAGRLA